MKSYCKERRHETSCHEPSVRPHVLASRGSRRGVLAAINVTPLVDVCLVMLILYMITPILPNLTSKAALDLPATRKPAELPAGAAARAKESLL